MSEKFIPCSWCRAALRADAKTCPSCGAPLSPQTRADSVTFARALPPGTRLRGGDYEIQDVIGQGRFGITYRALNQRLNRLVAVKEWFPASCEREGRQVLAGANLSAAEFAGSKTAFLDEARVLARFDDAALVSVFAAWEENGSAYMEMELLHGPTLAQVLGRFHHLKTDDALRLFAPILGALEELHAQNWLHRDLNPQNIILRDAAFEATNAASCVEHARAVVIDFGAARQIVPNVSQDFAVLVTPGYAPLEQYATRARRGAYCDLYALCATLYHALSGQVPPPAPDRASGAELISLRELAPAVPESLCRAIASGLEIEIARRPQNVRELRALMPPLPDAVAIAIAPNALQVLALPIDAAKPPKAVGKAPQVLAAPLAWPPSPNDASGAKKSPSQASAGNGLWWIAGPLGFALLVSVLRPRPPVVRTWSVPATRLIDESVYPNFSPTQPRYVPNFPSVNPTTSPGGKISQPVFSSTGVLAGVDRDEKNAPGLVRLWDAASGRVLHTMKKAKIGMTTELIFSPDGSLLAICEGQFVNDMAAFRSTAKTMARDKNSPNQETLRVVEVSSGKTLWQRPMAGPWLRWTRDGSTLLMLDDSNEVSGYAARSGQEILARRTEFQDTLSADIPWSASSSGQEISASRTGQTKTWTWKLKSDESADGFSFAPDNSWMMSLGLYGAHKTATPASSSSSSDFTTYTGGRARFYDLKTGKLINVWSGKSEDDSGAGFGTFFSPRGRYVGIRRFDNVLRVWEVRTHRDFAFRWPASFQNLTRSATAPPPISKTGARRAEFIWQSSEFSPDENLILLLGITKTVRLVDLSARTMRETELSLKMPEKPSTSASSQAFSPVSIVSLKASFTADNQHIVWVNAQTGQMGRLSVDDFTKKVPVEIIDGATSQPS